MNDDIKSAVDYIARGIEKPVAELWSVAGQSLRGESIGDIGRHVLDYSKQGDSAIKNKEEFAKVVLRAMEVRDYKRRF